MLSLKGIGGSGSDQIGRDVTKTQDGKFILRYEVSSLPNTGNIDSFCSVVQKRLIFVNTTKTEPQPIGVNVMDFMEIAFYCIFSPDLTNLLFWVVCSTQQQDGGGLSPNKMPQAILFGSATTAKGLVLFLEL